MASQNGKKVTESAVPGTVATMATARLAIGDCTKCVTMNRSMALPGMAAVSIFYPIFSTVCKKEKMKSF